MEKGTTAKKITTQNPVLQRKVAKEDNPAAGDEADDSYYKILSNTWKDQALFREKLGFRQCGVQVFMSTTSTKNRK